MNERGSWNVGARRFARTPVMMIRSSDVGVREQEGTEKNRLLILSHSIAARGVPAIYRDTGPEYVFSKCDTPCVVAFDIDNQLRANVPLPFWATFEEGVIEAISVESNEIYQDLARAMNLWLRYKHHQYAPLYFSSFLLFPETPHFSEPFVFQMAPIISRGEFAFRHVVGGNMDAVVNPPRKLRKGDVVLIPPHDNPFTITDVTEEKITAKNLAGYEKVFEPGKLNQIVLLCHPPDPMFRLKVTKAKNEIPGDVGISANLMRSRVSSARAQGHRSYFEFGVTEFYDFDDDDVNLSVYEKMGIGDGDAADGEGSGDFYELYDNDFGQMIDEEVEDIELRRKLRDVFQGEPVFPSPVFYFEPSVWSFISFFQFDRSYSPAQQPEYAKIFSEEVAIEGTHLGVPQVIANMNGTRKDMPANVIMEEWEGLHALPLSREKNCPFVVFYFDGFSLDVVKDFFASLRSSFANLGCGELVPFPNDNAYMKVTNENFVRFTEQFFARDPTTEFLRAPVLSFVIYPQGFSRATNVHSVCTYISEETVLRASSKYINLIAFIIYSRVRIFDPSPFGVNDEARTPGDPYSLFFGYRYQAPYLLKRLDPNADTIKMHICWDPVNYYTALVDDIGSVSHMFKYRSLEHVSKLISDMKFMKHQHCCSEISLSVLSQSLSKDLMRDIVACFERTGTAFSLFTMFPTACVQASFDSLFDDDVIVFSDVEESSFNGLKDKQPPDATCFVVSPGLTSYMISHYFNNTGEAPRLRLEKFAQQMSHLSWIASKATTGRRVVSFPPHLASLLSKNRLETETLSRFTFLPARVPGEA